MHTQHTSNARSRHARLAVLTSLAMAACGGGGSDDGVAEPVVTQTVGTGADMPLVGADAPSLTDIWIADVDSGGQVVNQVVGTTVAGGEPAFEFQQTLSRPGLATETQRYALVVRDGPDLRYPLSGFNPLFAAFGPRPSLLSGPLRVGHRAVLTQGPVPVAADYDNDGRNDTASLRIETVVVGVDTRTTPAGTFANCVHTTSIETYTIQFSSGQAPGTRVTTSDSWSAPGGVGTVVYASLTEDRQQGVLLNSQTFGFSLVGYRAGNLSGGSIR